MWSQPMVLFEMLLSFGLVAFAVRELIVLRRLKRRDEEAARERR